MSFLRNMPPVLPIKEHVKTKTKISEGRYKFKLGSRQKIFFSLTLVFLCSVTCSASQLTLQQPRSGPAGDNYPHAAVTYYGPYHAKFKFTNNNYRYFVYEPVDPTPEEAPVVLFLHGWRAFRPKQYWFWIEHIVKKGYIVVWVQFQRSLLTPPWLFTEHVLVTWEDALKRLYRNEFQVRPEKENTGMAKTAIVGHSTGAYLGSIIAAKANGQWLSKIPKPYAIVCIEPGGLGFVPKPLSDKIDPNTKVIIAVGDEDDLVCTSTAVSLWNWISHISNDNKDFLLVHSDYHDVPNQIANHYFPNTSGYRDTSAVDARDFYVTFKISVAALNCVFKDFDCEYALGNGSEEQLYMGEWSDGEPIEPMLWVEDPDSLEPSCMSR